MRRVGIIAGTVLVLIVGSLVYHYSHAGRTSTTFRTTGVERGKVVSNVSSTGTVNPVTTVLVGSQVSGKITALNADFNTEVTENQIVARIEPDNFEAVVRQAEADLSVARADVKMHKAGVERARADLENARSGLTAAKAQTEKSRVALADAKKELDPKRTLYRSESIPKRHFETVEAQYDQAVAQLDSAVANEKAQECMVRSREASLKMATAQVTHALARVKHGEAALENAKIDLEHTIIRSPVKGVVISREVDLGQTVIARLQSPTLFTIAQDLSEMQVDTSLDEADIGRIAVGQDASFTVDAYPGRTFTGKVDEIRKAPLIQQNVVTYTVVVSADNFDLALLPGMTASVQIVVEERPEVLNVPNAALRFQPRGPIASSGSGAAGTGVTATPTGSAAERLKVVIKTLKLDKDQQAQVWAWYKEARGRVFALTTKGATGKDMQAAIKVERRRMMKSVRELCTPEQRKRWPLLRAKAVANVAKKGRVWLVNDQGLPLGVDVVTGISDGSITEIRSGDLKAGQKVIVGVEKQPK